MGYLSSSGERSRAYVRHLNFLSNSTLGILITAGCYITLSWSTSNEFWVPAGTQIPLVLWVPQWDTSNTDLPTDLLNPALAIEIIDIYLIILWVWQRIAEEDETKKDESSHFLLEWEQARVLWLLVMNIEQINRGLKDESLGSINRSF